MKSLSLSLGVILVAIGFTLFYHAEVWGEDWRLYGQDGFASYYYDADKTIRPSKNIVRVWGKVIYAKEGVTELATRLGKGFRTLNFSIDLYEFNCEKREYKELQRTFFSQRATYLGEQSDLSGGYVNQGSIQEKLYKIICKSMGEDLEPTKSQPSRSRRNK
ncbi:MAG: surface-adhesin E family protein [Thermodesulfobacteriota bacterium]|jgi:hypothetical protein